MCYYPSLPLHLMLAYRFLDSSYRISSVIVHGITSLTIFNFKPNVYCTKYWKLDNIYDIAESFISALPKWRGRSLFCLPSKQLTGFVAFLHSIETQRIIDHREMCKDKISLIFCFSARKKTKSL